MSFRVDLAGADHAHLAGGVRHRAQVLVGPGPFEQQLHLAVLAEADLVTTVWRGREKLHYLNAAPINAIAERWIDRYARERVHVLADLKRALEQEPMTETAFAYTTYINTTPERLWQALTDPEFTRRYWGVTFVSEWTAGATMTWEENGVTISDPEQVVLESEPGRRLVYTWHTFTPEFGAASGLSDDVLATIAKERRSKVTFEIEPVGRMVKLTVVHDDFDPGSTVVTMVSEGWPRLLSDLKSLLEEGKKR